MCRLPVIFTIEAIFADVCLDCFSTNSVRHLCHTWQKRLLSWSNRQNCQRHWILDHFAVSEDNSKLLQFEHPVSL